MHAAPGVHGELALHALEALSRAYRRLVLVRGLPAPLSDGVRGGNPSLDWYLLAAPGGLSTQLDPPRLGGFDRASLYCTSDTRVALERSASLCVAEASAAALDAGETPHLRRAYATHLWWSTGGLADEDFLAIDYQQANPEEPLAGPGTTTRSEGGALLFEYLDAKRGPARRATLSTAMLSLGASVTPTSEARWHNEPDVFDVLRSTVRYKRAAYAHLMNQLAVERAFVGSRDDGTRFPSLGWAGEFGRVRFDWKIPVSSLPRRVASARPVYPTGSFYVLVDLDEGAIGDAIGMQAKWEAPVVFGFSVVHLDKQGRHLRQLELPFVESAQQAEQRIVNLEATRYLLIIGTNLGGVDLAHPFDPDVTPYEPHAATVYLLKR